MIKNGRIITRQLSPDILHGVTRKTILALAKAHNLDIQERSFTIAEAQDADEVFTTASPIYALPVVELDGKAIGDGRPGALTKKLRALFLEKPRPTQFEPAQGEMSVTFRTPETRFL